MSKRANPKIVGIFVLGAIALTVIGILVFGATDLFKKTETMVAFFSGSVKGLSVGAPVSFRGVQIGTVSDIQVSISPDQEKFKIPVLMKFEGHRIGYTAGGIKFEDIGLHKLIERGLRAQLVVQSLVTGQLMIEIDFHPKTPIKLVGAMPQYPEIPTIPSDLESFLKRFEEVPIERLVSQLGHTLTSLQNLLGSKHLQETLSNLASLTGHLDNLAVEVSRKVDPVSGDVSKTLQEIRKLTSNLRTRTDALAAKMEVAIDDAGRLIRHVDDQMPGIEKTFSNTADTTRKTLRATTAAVTQVGDTLAQTSPLMYNLTSTLEEISSAARSIRILADYLQQHPEALLQGKGGY